MAKMKVLGVCGGNGVILHPFKNYLIGNIEPRSIFHTPGQVQWDLNFKGIPFHKDFPAQIDQPDVIIGAPDCGHSSILAYSRAKKLADPKDNKSLNFFIAAVNDLQPKYFMMENLTKFLDTVDIHKVFPDYRLRIISDSVARFGNSQKSRVRLVIVGIRKDCPYIGLVAHVELPDRNRVYMHKVGVLLEGLGPKEIPELCHVRESDDSTVPLYIGDRRKITVREARKIWNTKFKHSRRWKVENSKMVNQPGVYRVFKHDLPLTVRKQSRQFDPDGYMLTPRDIARIQGVPDTFHLWYSDKQHLYCINKARATVAKSPPYEIATWFYWILTTKLSLKWESK